MSTHHYKTSAAALALGVWYVQKMRINVTLQYKSVSNSIRMDEGIQI